MATFPKHVLDKAKTTLQTEKTEKRTKFNTKRKLFYDNVEFKSSLEITCYRQLKKNGIEFGYENQKFTISNPHTINSLVTVYCSALKTVKAEKSTSTNKKRQVSVFEKLSNNISAITYTPDFTLEYKDYFIIIETKGRANDVYPYKRKLFLKFLSNFANLKNKKVIFFEPHNYSHIEEMITIIKSL